MPRALVDMTLIPAMSDATVGIAVWVAIGLGYVAAVVRLVRQGRAPYQPHGSTDDGATDVHPAVASSIRHRAR